MLPMTVLRRFDCVLAPTKAKVLAAHKRRAGGRPKVRPRLGADFPSCPTPISTFRSSIGRPMPFGPNDEVLVDVVGVTLRRLKSSGEGLRKRCPATRFRYCETWNGGPLGAEYECMVPDGTCNRRTPCMTPPGPTAIVGQSVGRLRYHLRK